MRLIDDLEALLDVVLPRHCVLCRLPAGRANVCRGCRADLPWIIRPCARCGMPLPPDTASPECAKCPVATRGIDRIIAALAYEYPVDRMVAGIKYQQRFDMGRALGEMLVRVLRQAGDARSRPDFLVPVPLHRRRHGRRGYNQAVEIAQPVARAFGIRMAPRLARRVRDTPEQAGLSGRARRSNLRAAFCITCDVSRADIALVDDVVTTGSTASELARTFRAAGAASVQVWTAAAALKI